MQSLHTNNSAGSAAEKLSRRRIMKLGGAAVAIAGFAKGLGIVSEATAQTTQEQATILGAHNGIRMHHCSPMMFWWPDAEAGARQWASRSPQTTGPDGSVSFGHDPDRGDYGENLAWGPNLTAIQAIELWYSEFQLYNFANPGFHPSTGHFTQLVWFFSAGLGMAMERRGEMNLWVARYYPAGNIEGAFEFSVFFPGFGPLCQAFRRDKLKRGAVPPAVAPPAR